MKSENCNITVISLIFVTILMYVGIASAQTSSDIAFYFATPPSISDLKPDSMTVTWHSFPNFNQTTHYQVQINNQLYGASTKFERKLLKGLVPGRTAKISVVTYHEGKIAGISSPTIILMPPDVPQGVTAYKVGSASLGLIWNKSISANKYKIYEYPNTLLATVDGASNSVFLSGLTPGASLTFVVTALNYSGESYMSSQLSVQLLPPPPSMSVKASEIGQSWFVLHWTPVEEAVGYKIFVNDEEKAEVDAQTLKYRLDGLATGTAVSVKMKAVNNTGISEISEPIIVQLIPDTPVLSLVTVSSYSCTLRWSAANGTNYYKIYEDNQWAIANLPATTLSVTLTDGITPGAVASYSVKAVNGAGESDFSNIVIATFTSVSTQATLLAMQPDLMECGIREPHRISKKYRGKPIVVIQFPTLLENPELALEARYIYDLAVSEDMKNVRFLVIFSQTIPDLRQYKSKNIEWKKISKHSSMRVNGKIPVVSFYNSQGYLQKVTRISMIILTESDIYKWLPETLEKNGKSKCLYHEEKIKFDNLQKPQH